MLAGACNTAGWFLFTNRTLPHTRRTYGNGLFDHSNFRLVHSGFCQCFHILAICGYEPPAYHPRPPLARFCPTVLSRVRRVCSADFSVLCQSRRLRSASSNAVSGGAFQGVTPSFHSSEYQLERQCLSVTFTSLQDFSHAEFICDNVSLHDETHPYNIGLLYRHYDWQ